MSIPLIMAVVYLVVTTAAGFVIAWRNKKADSTDYLTAEKKLKWYFIVPLLFAEMMAGAATIGKAQTGYTTGISGVWVNWGMAIGMVFFIAFAARFYRAMHRKYGVLTVPEAYKYMFDTKTRVVMLVILCVVYCYLYSSQPTSAAALLSPMLGWDPVVTAWVASLLMIAVTLLGGMKGVAILNLLHMAVMYIGLIWCTAGAFNYIGGISALIDQLPASYWSLLQPNVSSTVANAVAIGISFMAAATMVTANISARSPRDMAIGTWGAAAIIVPFATLPALIGMCAFVALPGINSSTALFAMAATQGDAVSGIVSMAILAAIWSSAPAALLFCANALSRDLLSVVKPDISDTRRKLYCMVFIVVLGIIATWAGLRAASILGQLYSAFQIRSVVAIVLLVAMFWKRVPANAAFWSMLLGGGLAAAWAITGSPFGVAPIWVGCGSAVVILVVGTLMSKEAISPGYRRYYAAKRELEIAEGRRVSPELLPEADDGDKTVTEAA